MENFFLYIVTNKPDGVIYIGITNELERRIREHKQKQIKGFTFQYNLDKLVYYESFGTYSEAFQRERRMKKWNREWKVKLIKENNPDWKDLAIDWY